VPLQTSMTILTGNRYRFLGLSDSGKWSHALIYNDI